MAEMIQPVAEAPTFIAKLQTLWDFTVVKLAALAAILGALGLGIPTIQQTIAPDFLTWVPAWFIHACQLCGILVTLGIIPARGIAQPNLPAKQAARIAKGE